MLFEGAVGPAPSALGTHSPLRLGRQAEGVVQDAHARYHEAAMGRALFSACLPAGVALGTALTATAVTLTLYNPVGSGVNLSVIRGGVAITTAPAGSAALVWASNHNAAAAVPSAVTALASGARAYPLGNSNTPQAQVYSAATLPAAPSAIRTIATALATGSTSAGAFADDVQGAIEVGPGCAVTIQNIGTAMSGIVDITWEEIPII
jgi:hypothetical protein